MFAFKPSLISLCKCMSTKAALKVKVSSWEDWMVGWEELTRRL